jgi:hypothetical protein
VGPKVLGQILGARYIDDGCNGMTGAKMTGAKMTGAKMAGAKTAPPTI